MKQTITHFLLIVGGRRSFILLKGFKSIRLIIHTKSKIRAFYKDEFIQEFSYIK